MANRDLRPVLARAGIVVAAAVVVLALFLILETARRNGQRLEQALDDLAEQRKVNRQLLVRVDRQGDRIHTQTVELRSLRDALRRAGVDPADVLTPRGGRNASPPPAGSSPADGSAVRTPPPPGGGEPPARPGGGGERSPPRRDTRPDPPPDSEPPPDEPTPPPDGGGGGDREQCRVVDPLFGGCLLRADTPVDPLVDQLAP